MKLCSYQFIFFVFASIIKLSTPLLCKIMTNYRPSSLMMSSLQDHHDGSKDAVLLQSECHCGKVVLDISLPREYSLDDDTVKVWNCHC